MKVGVANARVLHVDEDFIWGWFPNGDFLVHGGCGCVNLVLDMTKKDWVRTYGLLTFRQLEPIAQMVYVRWCSLQNMKTWALIGRRGRCTKTMIYQEMGRYVARQCSA
jgi:hypothetical protein